MTHSRTFRVLFVGSLSTAIVALSGFTARGQVTSSKLGVEEPKPIRAINTNHSPTPVGFKMALSRDGKVLATGGHDGVRVWNTSTWEVIQSIESVWPLIALSPDGRTVVAGERSKDHNSGSIEIWSVEKGERIVALTAHRSGSTHPYMHYTRGAFSPDGSLLVTVGYLDTLVKVWDTANWTETRVLGRTLGLGAVALSVSPDGSLLAISEGGIPRTTALSVRVIGTGETRYAIQDPPERPIFLTFSPDGTMLAGSFYDGSVRIWNAKTGNLKLTLEGTAKPVWCVNFSPDGRLVAGGDYNGVVTLWDADSGDVHRTFGVGSSPRPNGPRIAGVQSLVFTHDGKSLLSGHHNGTINVWSVSDRETQN